MKLIGDGLESLAGEKLKRIFDKITSNPIKDVLTGTIVTAIIQSSSAVTGILITLAAVGSLPIDVTIPLLYGTNIGTCVTALISSVGTSRTAKKAALIHLFFNTIGSLVFLIPPISHLLLSCVTFITPGTDGGVVAQQIANSHTIFNVLNTMLLLPFTKQLVALANFILPGNDEIEISGVKYIDDRMILIS